MQLNRATVLITGANRGIGLAFAQEALARGAAKVYAAARVPDNLPQSLRRPDVVPLRLDVTDPEQVAAAARACADVDLVINNAGIASTGGFLAEDAVAAARRHLETNFFGVLHMARAFAPVLAAHGGGAMLNVLSIASWINGPLLGNYGMSKSAAWALTNGLRAELEAQKTQVLALHMGFVDTDLTHGMNVPKLQAQDVVRIAYDALEAGAREVLADDFTKQVHAGLSAQPAVYLQQLPRGE